MPLLARLLCASAVCVAASDLRAAAAASPAPAAWPARRPVSGRGPMRPRPPPPAAARAPLSRDGLTDVRLWPAPVSETHAGSAAFAQHGGADVAAQGADCPFLSHGPATAQLPACEAACAANPDCNTVNFNPGIRDCVFRTCANPNAPVLSPAPGYSVFTTNSTRAALVLDPTSFTFAATGFSDASLAAALARYAALAFPYGAAQAPASAATLLGLRVDVAGDAPLAEGVNETYALDVRAGWAVLQAATVYGAMRGLETFSQLLAFNLSTREYSAQPTTVVDFPRFPVRAVMLDTARTFLSVAAIKSVMDAMSMLKLNVLHLHLTDDNSWPVVIDAWPRLALLSAYSNFSHTYSKADLAALVAFGRERGIRLVPEFDTPAHFSSLFAAYPEFAAVSVDPKTNNTFLCLVDPSKEETFAFLADVWRELAASFPDETLMIGGDEAWGCWAESPAVAAWMKGRGYGVQEALHYYERRMIAIVRSLGRKTMAWLDIDGWPLANETWARDYPDVTLNVWTGCYSGRWQDDVAAFTAKNGSVVVSGPFYITQQNGRPDTPHFTPQDMYETDLYNFTGNATVDLRLIRGGELCAWDDAAQTDSGDILVSLSPYMLAVAEAWWSPQAATSGVGFDEQRAHQHRCRMGARGIASHPFYAFGAYCPVEFDPAQWARSP